MPANNMTLQTPQFASCAQTSHLARLRAAIQCRTPPRDQLFPLFSVIVFIVFTWALYQLADQVPGWLSYLTVWNVLTLLMYILAAALFESAVLLGVLLLASLLFPQRAFKDIFVAQGCLVMVCLTLVALLLQSNIRIIYSLELWQLLAGILLFLAFLAAVVLLFAAVIRRFTRLKRLLDSLASHMTVFGYCYTLLGVVSLIIVLARIIF